MEHKLILCLRRQGLSIRSVDQEDKKFSVTLLISSVNRLMIDIESIPSKEKFDVSVSSILSHGRPFLNSLRDKESIVVCMCVKFLF